MNSTLIVLKEIFSNIIIAHRLAINDLIVKNKGNLLGFLWLWINPSIQILIYGIVFGLGLRGSAPVNGINFFHWLIPGFIIWDFINGCVTPGSRSIIAKMNIVTKMKFPVSITPLVTVLSELYIHILMIITIVLILIVTNGSTPSIYWMYLPYYTFCAVCFLLSFAIFNSAISTVMRDYQHIVYNMMRTLFFITPVLFPEDSMQGTVMKTIFSLNPFSYLLIGYRESLVYHQRSTFLTWELGVYFWSITLLFLIIGCSFHVKMRKNLLDYS